ncbi:MULTISPECIES: glycosyltransferase family 4 protein [Caldilinea]|uniref:Putative glycosyltransferase n=1 Tax=Caldilinea aerophila (strain DSM 14535 / JCM 11387 / NBRC 104270 / STL-6-O1) TaxID=926550 RepID=I0I1E0_CALAS|nr:MULTISPECIES: glycosyltransferase family 1 protein [Caldilinea]BAL99077.1 putative glycosyltransferase [Caldilinea aerophila DSM 14535 = NBRC 104270]GIV74331.1 MAG: glycosyl transferase family 1 [Caldilinea sp.]
MRNYILDIRTATSHFPGIGRYVTSLASALAEQLYPDERLTLLGHPAQVEEFVAGQRARVIASVTSLACDDSPFTLQQQWRIPRLLRAQRNTATVSLYHSPYYLMPYRPGLPTVLTFYDLIPLRFPAYVSLRARMLFRFTAQMALCTARHVIAISEASRRDLLATFSVSPERVTAIPLAAEARFCRQPRAVVERVLAHYSLPAEFLLYVGSNKPHKNLVNLVHAYAALPPKAPLLLIAGPWDARHPDARQAAQQLGVSERVRFLGIVDDKDLPALYSGALAFVFPSLYEGFGLPALEAMACGAPVACSNASSLPEVVGDAALLFDPSDVRALTEAMQRLIEDAALRQRLSERGLRRAGTFSWQRNASATLSIYRRIAG